MNVHAHFLHSSPLFLYLTYFLTYSMEQNPSWESNWFSASQEIHHILWNPKVHYRIQRCPPPVPILNHIKSIHFIYNASCNCSWSRQDFDDGRVFTSSGLWCISEHLKRYLGTSSQSRTYDPSKRHKQRRQYNPLISWELLAQQHSATFHKIEIPSNATVTNLTNIMASWKVQLSVLVF